mgnify:CR=1 FL=1
MGQLDSLLAVVCLSDDVVALSAQDLHNVESNEGFILSDDNAPCRARVR